MQLRALARAAVHGKLKVMLPMVTIPEELAASRVLLDESWRLSVRMASPARRPLLGIMVEVPAAAIAPTVSMRRSFSIGSNDLTQYVTAAGRDIGAVADLADPPTRRCCHLIATVAQHGRAAGRDVSLCGDAGAEPRCVEALLRAGVRSLSVAPEAVGRAKQAIAAVDLR